VLLALRDGTGYADLHWNLPSGELEIGEDAVSGLIRETAEETGVQLARNDSRLAATVHHRNAAGQGRVGLVFAVPHDPARHGEPVNTEPHNCSKIEWFPVDLLPTNTYPYTAACVRAFRHRQPFALSRW